MTDKLIIHQVGLYKLSIPLVEPFTTSLGTDDCAENIIVKIITNEGVTGFGECSPYMPINGESQDTCFIVGQYFAKLLVGKNALDIASCIEEMDKLIYGNTSIKSAFDIALHDIASQYAGLPLYRFLGGKNDKTIITDYTVSIGDPDKMANDAAKIKSQGYPFIKIKLGKGGSADVTRIQKIREAVGNDIPLRIDANQGWNIEEAISTLQQLGKYNIQHCEEPIPKWQFMELPKVRKASPIPIMSDESCSDEHDAERLIQLKACDYFNIKLCKSGGLYKGIKMLRLAEANNIHVQVGAMLESRLAMTAFAHFALCSPLIEHYDFDTALMFKEDPVTGGIIYEKNGVIKMPDAIGLGATIDDDRLNKMQNAVIK